MIFDKSDADAPEHVKKLAWDIQYVGFDRFNFYAYYRCYRKNYRNDQALAAGYLALRKQDPCRFGLSNYCIWSGTSVAGHSVITRA